MKGFKKLKFKSSNRSEIEAALTILKKLGYSGCECCFSVSDAVEHKGFCTWDDGELTKGWFQDERFKTVTLEDLKEMVGKFESVLWLNIKTLEERVITDGKKYYSDIWVQVPEGATFATGDEDNFVFRKDGWYYDEQNGGWVETNVLLKHFPEYKYIKLFWVKSGIKNLEDLKEMVGDCGVASTDKKHVNNKTLSSNYVTAWEKVFGETMVESVRDAIANNKRGVNKLSVVNNTTNKNPFTLDRLLGCEVKFNNPFRVVNPGYIFKIMWDKVVFVCCDYQFEIVHIDDLTFFTEDGDELTFDEYVQLYYPKG